MAERKIVCGLGMHHSGTNLLTRLLNLLGVELGSDELFTTEPFAANAKGYWENKELTAINDAILRSWKGSWDAPPRFEDNWQIDPLLNDVKFWARAFSSHFGDEKLWGWKDPRTCLMLRFL